MRRTHLVGTTALLGSLLWLAPLATPVGGTDATRADTDPPDPVEVGSALQDRFDDRFGGYWIEPADGGDDDIVHVAVVERTAADRRAASRLAGGAERVEVHDAAHSYDQLAAAREAVAASLDRGSTGDFAVGVDVPRNRVAVETERGDAAATRLLSLAALRNAASAAAPSPAAGGTDLADQVGEIGEIGDVGEVSDVGDVGADVDDIDVVTGSEIGIDLLGATPTTFPPYEAGLHLLVPSGGVTIRCTSAYTFANPSGTYGSTAGHCGRTGDTVRVGDTPVEAVSINPFQTATEVRADAALYSLSARGWASEPVLHGADTHRAVTGSLADSQITDGLRLCFDGRTSGEGNCGTVNAAGRLICCDSGNRSFVFSCITQGAQAGDSGGPVYQVAGANRVRAAGILSSSVTIGEQRSMCFTTIDNIERETGTTIVTAG